MSEKRIGKVISVDSFRVVIQLDDDLKSLYKSGFNDIYEIARINSYVIIPVGADRIVGLITRVKVQEESELDNQNGSITLPKAARYLIATMIGTIEATSKGHKYLQGVYNFPILDNPVWYVTQDDLDKIFDTKEKADDINYTDDYYLPVGESPAFNNYQIKINPDKFFGKHAAILGNTGSGKSCTVATILQSLLEFSYNDNKQLKSAHIIIFDTNGEYKRAFFGDDKNQYEGKESINPFYIDQEGLKVPYWFMNYDDFDFLFEPSSNTQAPILKRAISLAKDRSNPQSNQKLSPTIEKSIYALLDISFEELKKKKCKSNYGNWEYKKDNEIIGLAETLTSYPNKLIKELSQILQKLGEDIKQSEENANLQSLKEKLIEYQEETKVFTIATDKNIDLPIWFSFHELITKYIDEAINEHDISSNRIREFLGTLRLRLFSYFNDLRIASPLHLQNEKEINNSLAKFLAFTLGDFCKIYSDQDDDLFSKYYEKSKSNQSLLQHQVTIIDMSMLPFEVLETITGLIGRMTLEFMSRLGEDRGKCPTILVLEEAQNYIPEKKNGERDSISKKVFERISREGRKFGLSLIVASQRPSEVSKTVLSQCNSFIIHRLQNPDDQKYVRQLVSAANEDILQQLPILPQRHAIIMGDGVRTPAQVKLREAKPTPRSNDPEFVENWLKEPKNDFPNYHSIAEAWEKGERQIHSEKQENTHSESTD